MHGGDGSSEVFGVLELDECIDCRLGAVGLALHIIDDLNLCDLPSVPEDLPQVLLSRVLAQVDHPRFVDCTAFLP